MVVVKRRRRKSWLYGLAALLIVGSYVYWSWQKPLPSLQPRTQAQQLIASTAPANLTWPATGQAAVGLMETDILESHGDQKPVPIASTAKIITSLVVLEEKPLKAGQSGPVITLTEADVASYNNYAAQNGSRVPVAIGEQINQYQMLQAIMIPSANNIADTMAIWAFGSLEDYTKVANAYLAKYGLKNTHVGVDASGLSPTTTSTAADLVKLGQLAMKEPVLVEIVGQSSATGIPMAETVRNVNSLLGVSNIIGIKTGNTDQAGGVFVSASKISVNNKPVIIVTAITGAPNIATALQDSLKLVQSAQANFQTVTLAKAGKPITQYQVPWGGTVSATAAESLTIDTWRGETAKASLTLIPVGPKDQTAGEITLLKSGLTDEKTIAVKLQTHPSSPSLWWRLLHPFN